ncbi:family 3 O-methyltransferase [Periconia macrospinosa]|uniref:Family 3 O-methyltransferase n=1 Tax=Periconia macrospinosa TaxID=97972 RepID=A0A2V1CZG9_9PLEO|nr:family 3 O-methyltransferase [Periconia macrospinosa]
MREIHTELYPNEHVSKAVGEYAFNHSTALSPKISDVHGWALETQEKSFYMISPLQAQFHIWLAKAVGAKRILEIGTYIGFSTLAWSQAVGPFGHVTTLEFNPEYASIAKETLQRERITNTEILVGDAGESILGLSSTLQEPFDLIFIDADKPSYPKYLSLIESLSNSTTSNTRLLKEGGIVLADNVLHRGLVVDSSPSNPWSSAPLQKGERKWTMEDFQALDDFNKALASHDRFETFLLPMFDGVGMGRLRD